MNEFRKTFELVSEHTGEIRNVTFECDGETVHARCTCTASDYGTLCHHIMDCIAEDAEILSALKECGLWQVYEEHLATLKEADKLKRRAAGLKKKFARLLLS